MRQETTPTFEKVETSQPFAPAYDYSAPPIAITPTDWRHVCSCRFGEARQCGWSARTCWTEDCYRYDIFDRVDSTGRRQLAMRWWNGGGQGWLLTDDHAGSGEVNLLDIIAAMPDESKRWDACHFLWSAAHKSAAAAARETERTLKQAFVEGRLKKHKLRGQNRYDVRVI